MSDDKEKKPAEATQAEKDNESRLKNQEENDSPGPDSPGCKCPSDADNDGM